MYLLDPLVEPRLSLSAILRSPVPPIILVLATFLEGTSKAFFASLRQAAFSGGSDPCIGTIP